LAPAIIVIAPPFPEAELVVIVVAPLAVIILVSATIARAEPAKLSDPLIVTAPPVLK